MARHDFAPSFFTSDTHDSHKAALNFRPKFSSIEEMNQWIEDSHNSVVKNPKSWVYHHGDMGFAKRPLKLTGRIVLIRGNHDSRSYINYLLSEGIIVACFDKIVTTLHQQKFLMTHKPQTNWRAEGDNVIHTHGHLHGGDHHDPEFSWTKTEDQLIDVGVDCHWTKGRPVSVDEVLAYHARRTSSE